MLQWSSTESLKNLFSSRLGSTMEESRHKEVCCERVYLRRHAASEADIDTELFFGTPVALLKNERENKGWVRIRSCLDGYEGWLERASLAAWASREDPSTSLSITVVPLALGYREARDTAAATWAFPMGSRLRVSEIREAQEAQGEVEKAGREQSFVALRLQAGRRGGEDARVFVKRHQLLPLAECGIVNGRDWVSTALKFLNVPYLYGGGCYAGMDCSALLQVSMGVHAIACPRDSAPQERALGEALDWTGQGGRNPLPSLQRGDLVFWHRHVGVMVDGETMLHANAGSMATSKESVATARARIMGVEGEIRCIRRLRQ